jgi:hypothetical protein
MPASPAATVDGSRNRGLLCRSGQARGPARTCASSWAPCSPAAMVVLGIGRCCPHPLANTEVCPQPGGEGSGDRSGRAAAFDAFGWPEAPNCFPGRDVARSAVGLLWHALDVEALLVPSVAFLYDTNRGNLGFFLENVHRPPAHGVTEVTLDGHLQLDFASGSAEPISHSYYAPVDTERMIPQQGAPCFVTI